LLTLLLLLMLLRYHGNGMERPRHTDTAG